jgi:GAF domain-containing protein
MSDLIPINSQESTVSLDDINSLRRFGNHVLSCQTIEEICEVLFDLVNEKIHPQVSSLFLFQKNGSIERVNIRGIDLEGGKIDNDWLKDENYLPGESFSGSVVKPCAGTPYGIPIMSHNLKEYDLKYGEQYKEKIGDLNCGISVPLNGTHRTFGTIEVINKTNSNTGKSNLFFSEKDLCWLTVVGAHVSSAISRLRKIKEDQIIGYLTDQLIGRNTNSTSDTINDIARTVTDILTQDNLLPYKACIVRFENDGCLPIYVDSCSSDISFAGKRLPIRRINEGLVGKAYMTRQSVEINNINDKIKLFLSREWISEFNLKSFFCFPLVYQGKSVGVISLFTGYEYELHDSDRSFLHTVSCLLASCPATKRVQQLSITNSEIEAKLSHQYHCCIDIIDTIDGIKEISNKNPLVNSNRLHITELEKLLNELYGAASKLKDESSDTYKNIRNLSELWSRREIKTAIPSVIDPMQKVEPLLIHEFKIKNGDSNDAVLPMLIRIKRASWKAVGIPGYKEFYRSKEGKTHLVGCYGSYETIKKLNNDPDIISIEASKSSADSEF